MTRRLFITIIAVVLIASSAAAQKINWITKDELRAVLGSPDITLIDVRTGKEWDESDAMIKGAVREDPGEVKQWAGRYAKDARLLFYCA